MDGVALDRFSEVTNTGCGTPEFAAPEVFREDLYSYNVDIWSLGVMVFKMIVGRVSFLFYTSDLTLTVIPTVTLV